MAVSVFFKGTWTPSGFTLKIYFKNGVFKIGHDFELDKNVRFAIYSQYFIGCKTVLTFVWCLGYLQYTVIAFVRCIKCEAC